MGNPPGEKQDRGSGFQIKGIRYSVILVKIISGMIKCHQNHGYSSKYIDGMYSL
jgi:hypothetical protein